MAASKHWHNGGDLELVLYARSLEQAAAALLKRWKRQADSPAGAWDHGPLVMLYRHALELRLKELVDAGNPFLPAPVDAITLMQTHSLRWLAQIVCQIIRAVEWEDEFRCDGVANLKEFSQLMAAADALDPIATITRYEREPPSRVTVLAFARKTTALLILLTMTADALAATSVSQEENPTVH